MIIWGYRTLSNIFSKILSVTAAVSITALSVSGCGFTKTIEKVHTVDVPPNVLFLGDSIAEGYGLDGFSEDKYSCSSYANILNDRYKQELKGITPVRMTNDAVSGDTSGQLLEHLENGEFDGDLNKSDAIVISIGGNDILGVFLKYLQQTFEGEHKNIKDIELSDILDIAKNIHNMDSEMDTNLNELNSNIAEIYEYISAHSDAVIIFQTLYNPFEDMHDMNILEDFADEKIGVINKHIKDNSKTNDKQNYIVCDVAPDFIGKARQITNISQFDIHPNEEGHKVIADKVDESIRTQKYSYSEFVEIHPVSDFIKNNAVWIISGIVIISGGVILLIRNNKKERR